MDLGQNQFNGQIPRSLVKCKMLEFLNLGNNQIEDTFPSWLGWLPELKVLILRHNGFHGVIGKPKFNEFREMRILDLSFNKFVGGLPSHHFQRWKAMQVVDLGKLNYLQANVSFQAPGNNWFTSFSYSMTMTKAGVETKYEKIQDFLVAIDLSSNRFEGRIPEDVRVLKAVQFLNLSNNLLSGQIPSALANLTQLQVMDLSQNKLNGEIPRELVQLTFLEFFNVSHNQLIGPIPQGKQFSTFQNNSFEGNPGLCGKPLSKECYPEGSSPTSPSMSKRDDGGDTWFEFGWKVIMLGYGSGLLNGLILGYLFNPMKSKLFVKFFGRKMQNRRRGRRN
ncbi:putative receptor like protein 25 [Hibiscus syriacus]|uniref:putative receptor like protein 25 n=1 Tax=Hibiscus syriacus TaxID=106335 RepID=UPI0019234D12|nr:putative receptor like protein 25 [Hibiscus syriacus]